MKRALCITASDAPTLGIARRNLLTIPSGFFELPVSLEDRATCETDETLLQILAYVVVSDPAGRVLTYYRGGAGGENRLHGKISIGFGGHVEQLPGAGGLLALLQEDGARELQEEINVVPAMPLQFTGLIYDPTDAVGRVHLGLLAHHQLAGDEMLLAEEGHIDNVEFRELTDLAKDYGRLENWSKVAFDDLWYRKQGIPNPAHGAPRPAGHRPWG